jgi:cation diffusion facilitator CzcD-associated flavoprotein CzcO
MHSHDYKGDDPTFFRDKRVVVLGMGNSAMDIAVEASFSATHVYLAARRGAHVMPKYLFGKPIDQIGGSTRIPFAVRGRILAGMLKVYQGDMERYGLPKPDHALGEAHPTVSDDILSRMAHGTITAKPNIASLSRTGVRFADRTEVEADIVVYCTGYKVTFPFFDEDFIAAPGNDLPLFRRTFHPDIANVFFIGLLQPLGAIMPLAEHQSSWVADYLSGRYALPPERELRADIERERARMFKRYVASKRHTMQVDYDDFVAALAKERRRGEERARAQGNPRPVAPRAAAVPAA